MISLTKNRQYKLTGLISLLLILAVMNSASGQEVVTYFHNDALGSPVAATNEAGEVIWREEYLPYGERLVKQNSETNDTWFTGKQEDKATGLLYFGARWYDPVLGRFLSIDPVGFQEDNIHSFNRYAYANNNPYKFVDPDGRIGTLIHSLQKGVSLNQAAEIGGMGNAAIRSTANIIDAGSDIVNPVKGLVKTGIKRTAKSLKDQATELIPKNANKNRVTLRSPSQKMEVDLSGKAHGGIPTPHTKVSPRNMNAPRQPAYNTKNSAVRPTTQRDVRTVRKFLKRKSK